MATRFRFYNENTGNVHGIRLTCTTAELEEFLTSDIGLAIVSSLETKYGVHDFESGWGYVGFASYEVEDAKLDSLIEDWRQVFDGKNWIREMP